MKSTTQAAGQRAAQKNRGFLALAVLAVFATVPKTVSAGANVWTRLGPEGGPASALTIDPRNPATVFAVTDAGLYKSTNEGTEWSAVKPGPPCCISILLIHPQNSAIFYALTQRAGASVDRRVLKSIDGGTNWLPVNSGLPVDADGHFGIVALAIDPRNEMTLYAANALGGGGVFKTTDGGANWGAVNSGLPDSAPIAALAIDPQNPETIYASTGYIYPATNAGGVFVSTDAGTTWSAVNNGLPTAILRGYEYFSTLVIDPQNTGIIYAVANDAGVYRTADAGASWTQVKQLADVTVAALAADPRNSGTVYTGISGGIWKSVDGGEHWSALKTRLDADPYGPQAVAALAINPRDTDTVYGAGTYAGILKTTDGGATWSAVNSALKVTVPTSYALRFDPQNSAAMYAATDVGVFKTVDAGASWSAVNAGLLGGPVSALAINPQAAGTIYVLNSSPPNDEGVCCAQIFKSTDGGTSWDTPLAKEANGLVVRGARLYSFPSAALAMDPLNPDTLYVAGTFFTNVQKEGGSGVLRSVDGGASWSVVSSGLPVLNPSSNQGNSAFVTTLAIDPLNPRTLYAGISVQGFAPGSAIFKTTNGGASWKDSGMHGFFRAEILAIDPQNPSRVYVRAVDPFSCLIQKLPVIGGFGACGGLYRTTNGGASWTSLNSGLPNYITSVAIDPQNPETIYAGSPYGVFTSTDGGATWDAMNSGLTSIAVSTVAIDPRDPATVYAGTADGIFVITFVPPA